MSNHTQDVCIFSIYIAFIVNGYNENLQVFLTVEYLRDDEVVA